MKKSILKKATIMVIVLLVAIQFFKTKENKSIQVSENAITQHYDVPENIQKILKIYFEKIYYYIINFKFLILFLCLYYIYILHFSSLY